MHPIYQELQTGQRLGIREYSFDHAAPGATDHAAFQITPAAGVPFWILAMRGAAAFAWFLGTPTLVGAAAITTGNSYLTATQSMQLTAERGKFDADQSGDKPQGAAAAVIIPEIPLRVDPGSVLNMQILAANVGGNMWIQIAEPFRK